MVEKNLNPEQLEALTEALEDGQKIEAIKVYRDATGEGLKESKEFVERLIAELVEKDPERFSALARSQRIGCGTALLAVGLILAVATGVVVSMAR